MAKKEEQDHSKKKKRKHRQKKITDKGKQLFNDSVEELSERIGEEYRLELKEKNPFAPIELEVKNRKELVRNQLKEFMKRFQNGIRVLVKGWRKKQ